MNCRAIDGQNRWVQKYYGRDEEACRTKDMNNLNTQYPLIYEFSAQSCQQYKQISGNSSKSGILETKYHQLRFDSEIVRN